MSKMNSTCDDDPPRNDPSLFTLPSPSPDSSRPNTTKSTSGQKEYLGFPSRKMDIEPRKETPTTKDFDISPGIDSHPSPILSPSKPSVGTPVARPGTSATTKRQRKRNKSTTFILQDKSASDIGIVEDRGRKSPRERAGKVNFNRSPIVIPSALRHDITTNSTGNEDFVSDHSLNDVSSSSDDDRDLNEYYDERDDVNIDGEAQRPGARVVPRGAFGIAKDDKNIGSEAHVLDIRSSAPVITNTFARGKREKSLSPKSSDLPLAPLHIGKAKLFHRHTSCNLIPVSGLPQNNDPFGPRALPWRNSTSLSVSTVPVYPWTNCEKRKGVTNYRDSRVEVFLTSTDPITAVSFVNSGTHLQTLVNTIPDSQNANDMTPEDALLVNEPFYLTEYFNNDFYDEQSILADASNTEFTTLPRSNGKNEVSVVDSEHMAGLTRSGICNDLSNYANLQRQSHDFIYQRNSPYLEETSILIDNQAKERLVDDDRDSGSNLIKNGLKMYTNSTRNDHSTSKLKDAPGSNYSFTDSVRASQISCDGTTLRILPKAKRMEISTKSATISETRGSRSLGPELVLDRSQAASPGRNDETKGGNIRHRTGYGDKDAGLGPALNGKTPGCVKEPRSEKRLGFREPFEIFSSEEIFTDNYIHSQTNFGREDEELTCHTRVATPFPGVVKTTKLRESLVMERERERVRLREGSWVVDTVGTRSNSLSPSSNRSIRPSSDYKNHTVNSNHGDIYSTSSRRSDASLLDESSPVIDRADSVVSYSKVNTGKGESGKRTERELVGFSDHPCGHPVVRVVGEDRFPPNVHVNENAHADNVSNRTLNQLYVRNKVKCGQFQVLQNECSVRYRKYFDLEESRKETSKNTIRQTVSFKDIKFANPGKGDKEIVSRDDDTVRTDNAITNVNGSDTRALKSLQHQPGGDTKGETRDTGNSHSKARYSTEESEFGDQIDRTKQEFGAFIQPTKAAIRHYTEIKSKCDNEENFKRAEMVDIDIEEKFKGNEMVDIAIEEKFKRAEMVDIAIEEKFKGNDMVDIAIEEKFKRTDRVDIAIEEKFKGADRVDIAIEEKFKRADRVDIDIEEKFKGADRVDIAIEEKFKRADRVDIASVEKFKGADRVDIASVEKFKGADRVDIAIEEKFKGADRVDIAIEEKFKRTDRVDIASVEKFKGADLAYDDISKERVHHNQTFLTEVGFDDTHFKGNVCVTKPNTNSDSAERNSTPTEASKMTSSSISLKPLQKIFQEFSQRAEQRESNCRSGCAYVRSEHTYAVAKRHVCFKCLRLQRRGRRHRDDRYERSGGNQDNPETETTLVKDLTLNGDGAKERISKDRVRNVNTTLRSSTNHCDYPFNVDSSYCTCFSAGQYSQRNEKGDHLLLPQVSQVSRSTSCKSELVNGLDGELYSSAFFERTEAGSKMTDDEGSQVVQQLKAIQHCRQGAFSRFFVHTRKNGHGNAFGVRVQTPRLHHSLIASLMVPHPVTSAATITSLQQRPEEEIFLKGSNLPLVSPPTPPPRPQISVCSEEEANRLAQYGTA